MTLVQISNARIRPEHTGVGDQPWHHIVPGEPAILFLLGGSRIYALPHGIRDSEQTAINQLIANTDRLGPAILFEPKAPSLSLNIAQSCNLACSYCYADEGRFGGEPRMMSPVTAKEAIWRHIHESNAQRLSIGFIGGEPLLNRRLLHQAVKFAAGEAARKGVAITFGITTNGSLLEPQDLELLRDYRFAVTISLDGAQDVHDRLRKTKKGTPSFDQTIKRVAPLLCRPGLASVAARVTVTRQNLDVESCVDALAVVGFSEIGVSPLRTGPNPELCLQDDDWRVLLEGMKTVSTNEWIRTRQNREPLRFSNFAVALKQLHSGASRSLPCGSGTSYVSLSAQGDYYTCHRAIGDATLSLGDIHSGPSASARRKFVEGRRVDTQEPCRSCWARYLCGGGCHVEVLSAGRAGCDYIRGWLEHCISVYPHVLAERPDLLEANLSGAVFQ